MMQEPPDYFPTGDVLRNAVAQNVIDVAELTAELVHNSYTAQELEALGIEIDEYLIAFAAGAMEITFYPRWQFTETKDGVTVLIEGVGALYYKFPGSVLAYSDWANSRNDALRGKTPRQALIDEQYDRVERILVSPKYTDEVM